MGKKSAAEFGNRAFVPAIQIRNLIGYFADTPGLGRKLLAGSRLQPTRLAKLESDVQLSEVFAIHRNLTQHIGPDWPLRLVGIVDPRNLGALEVAFRSTQTLEEGLKLCAQFGRTRAPQLEFEISKYPSAVALVATPHRPMNDDDCNAILLGAMVVISGLIRSVFSQADERLEFHISWPEPAYAPLARSALKGKVKFGAKDCAIICPSSLCALPSPFSDPFLLASATAELERTSSLLDQMDIMIARVTRYLDRQREGRPTERDLAAVFGVSRRTLERRLGACGTSFRALLDDSLKRRAILLRRTGRHSRSEMAQLLGFGDPSSFSRACRRWFAE